MGRKLHAQHQPFPLSRPFRIARGVKTVADVVTVTIAEDGVTGRGEGVPYARYGETPEGALAAIEAARGLIEAGAGRAEIGGSMAPGAARNAVDCALWDLEAKRTGRTVAQLVGGAEPGPVASALTITIDTPEAMAAAASPLAHIPLLKVKVDADAPAARIHAVRAVAPGPKMIVDPNESWDQGLVEAMQPVLAEARVDLLEQPVPADEDGWLEGFAPLVPICADEAVHVVADLERVARRYQAVNVKLDKTGGLTEGLALARAARERGLKLMTGCMVSSSLSIAPALHLAMLSDFADLDGPWWLAEDRPGGIGQEDGVVHPPAKGFWGTS